MAARQRMQDLFTKYDANGDGVLSVEEMTDVFGKLGVKSKDAETVFAGADGNKDGVIQVTEFLDWLTSTKPTLTTQQDRKEGTVRMTITNTSDRRSKRFTITFTNCKNMTFPEGNPCSFLLKPGEALEKLIMQREEEGKGWRWSYRWSSRSEFTGVEDDPNAFVDESFPHDAASVGETKTCFKVGSAELWVRARVLGDPAEAKLFDQIRPQDILQGQVGDCWLMSALASLADHPDRIRALFTSDSLSEDGKCGVRLFDVEALAWTTVEIDEFVPCKIWGGVPVPVFAKALGEEIWVQLIEKAVAKWCGSYGALSGGGVGWAYQLLTGEVNQINYAKIAGKGLWRKKKMLRQKQLERGARNPRNSWWTWRNKDTYEPEKLFGLLQEHLSSGAMLSTTIAGGTSGVEEAKGNGLYTKHFYSMLSVTSVEMDDGTPIKLMELRNPWGKSEWKGDWSDSSDRWEENPKLRKILESEVKNDGRFWIPFEEWEKMYTCVVVCPPKTKARTRKAPNPKNSMDSESDVEGDAQPRTRHRKEDELLSSSAEEDDEKEDAGDDDEDFCAYL